MGGFTLQVRQPDSWEGWYWGSKHVWGHGFQGMMAPQLNVVKDITENCDMVLKWGCDDETTPWGFTGQNATNISYFWTESGIKQVYICPDLNFGAAVHADKWIPVLPNSDAALQLAIIYVWLKEGTWDKEYIETHAVGMDKVEAYVLGEEDGIPKSPEWASPKCGVPEWTIKALAREFAAKCTSIVHYFGGSMIRGPYSHEPGRLECILLGMQGLGGPGVHQWQMSYFGMPRAESLDNFRYFNPTLERAPARPRPEQRRRLGDAEPAQDADPGRDPQGAAEVHRHRRAERGDRGPVHRVRVPLPKEEGGSELHMIWTDTPCRITCWNHGNWTIEAHRDPSIECMRRAAPVARERLPLRRHHPAGQHDDGSRRLPHQRPPGTALPDVHAAGQGHRAGGRVQERLRDRPRHRRQARLQGADHPGQEHQGPQKEVFECMYGSKYMTWEEFEEKKYVVYPTAEDWEEDPPGLRQFYEDPENNPLKTPSGLLEFYSERIATHFPYDEERPPIPKWVERGVTHDERISSERADMFPLVLMSNHPRWRTHAQGDDFTWAREIPTGKVLGLRQLQLRARVAAHPTDAAARGIEHGDIVKIFNERGIVLAGACVWERLMPGVAYIDHGARHDPIIPGKVDRGGAINTIAPNGLTSQQCCGQATSGYLVEVQKIRPEEWETWRRDYPEAFEREYDPGAGLRFNGWVVEGGSK